MGITFNKVAPLPDRTPKLCSPGGKDVEQKLPNFHGEWCYKATKFSKINCLKSVHCTEIFTFY